jgi:hypothetical protein
VRLSRNSGSFFEQTAGLAPLRHSVWLPSCGEASNLGRKEARECAKKHRVFFANPALLCGQWTVVLVLSLRPKPGGCGLHPLAAKPPNFQTFKPWPQRGSRMRKETPGIVFANPALLCG